MANFGGFEMETPQEVLARTQAQRSRVMSQGNIHQQRSQNIESALDVLFGAPGMRDAKRRQDAIKRAQASQAPKAADEDQLDFEMRDLAAKRDAIADLAPDVASQINGRLLELGEAKMQRQRLLAADQRDIEMHALKKEGMEREARLDKLIGGNTYVVDVENNSAESFDLLNPAEAAPFEAAKSKPGRRVISQAQAFQLMLQDDAQAAALRIAMAKADNDRANSDGSKVTLKEVEKLSAGLLDLHATADRIFNVFDSNPDVLTGGSAGAAALDKVAVELGSIGRAASGGTTKEGTSIDSWLKQNSIQNTRMQGLVVGLAYSLAKTNDPGGRLSDNDLKMAVQMVGGNNPNPAAILSNLNDNIVKSSNSLIDRIETSDPATKEKMGPRLGLLKQRRDGFVGRMSKFAQGERGAEATGLNAGGEDIDAIVNKYKVPQQ
jgi:hypothetical protein